MELLEVDLHCALQIDLRELLEQNKVLEQSNEGKRRRTSHGSGMIAGGGSEKVVPCSSYCVRLTEDFFRSSAGTPCFR